MDIDDFKRIFREYIVAALQAPTNAPDLRRVLRRSLLAVFWAP
jgi:hypothetical protein